MLEIVFYFLLHISVNLKSDGSMLLTLTMNFKKFICDFVRRNVIFIFLFTSEFKASRVQFYNRIGGNDIGILIPNHKKKIKFLTSMSI